MLIKSAKIRQHHYKMAAETPFSLDKKNFWSIFDFFSLLSCMVTWAIYAESQKTVSPTSSRIPGGCTWPHDGKSYPCHCPLFIVHEAMYHFCMCLARASAPLASLYRLLLSFLGY